MTDGKTEDIYDVVFKHFCPLCWPLFWRRAFFITFPISVPLYFAIALLLTVFCVTFNVIGYLFGRQISWLIDLWSR